MNALPPSRAGAPAGTTWSVLLVWLLALSVGAAGQRGFPAQYGITNYGRVNENLYRGAQPDAAGIRNLKQLGIRTIINLRLTNDVWQAEALEAHAQGVLYTNVPISPFEAPDDAQVKRVLSLIETLPSPVFIHCQFGCDRTGTVIAAYRISHDRWPGKAALREAESYGMLSWALGMRGYILNFGKSQKR